MKIIQKLLEKVRLKQRVSAQLKTQNVVRNQLLLVKSHEQQKFDEGLEKSALGLNSFLHALSKKYQVVDTQLFQDLEHLLLSYDVGYLATKTIVEQIKTEVSYHNVRDFNQIKEIIVDKLFANYIQASECDTDLKLGEHQSVFLLIGVNGVGKTTTIAKLAYMFKNADLKVLMIAADTFRAGATEQLQVWAKRLGVEIVSANQPQQDPGTVIYQGLKLAKEQQFDLVLIDTSGRLENKVQLMNELKKIHGVIQKFDPQAPHETLLVIDATTGQNGLNQAQKFQTITNVSGIILTKLDSTSRGGIILAIKALFDIPFKYVGLGEQLEDLSPFDLEKLIRSITDQLRE